MDVISVASFDKIDLKGKVICFPTDTVYGIGCVFNDEDAIKKIYAIKKRSNDKPLAVLALKSDVPKLASFVPDAAEKLIEKYWPGPLTIILKKANLVPDLLTAGLPTIGIRMPNHEAALALIKHFGPMAATSVNLSGDMPLNDVKAIVSEFSSQIDYLMTSDIPSSSCPSAVVSCGDDGSIKVVRRGKIDIKA